MLVYAKALAPAVLIAVLTACGAGRHSPAGFRLPADGDPERGKVAFVQFECYTCHDISGADLPRSGSEPAFLVKLGGVVDREVTDGFLVTSIIHPSYRVATYPRHLITIEGKSRMPQYNDELSVRQLTDIVAFLQGHYSVAPPSARYVYH